jgi:hypothetical protein
MRRGGEGGVEEVVNINEANEVGGGERVNNAVHDSVGDDRDVIPTKRRTSKAKIMGDTIRVNKCEDE